MNKKLFIGSTVVLSLLISGTAIAASAFKTPAQSVSDLTKLPVDQVYEMRAEGKTYGEIASENGVLEEFKDEMLESKEAVIDERVQEGVISQETADAFKKELEERVVDCDGTPDPDRERLGQKFGGGMRFGGGMGNGAGRGLGRGMGYGRGFNR